MLTCTQNSHTHLIPGPRFPLGRAGHSVTRLAALRTVTHAVLAVHRAIGAIMEWLKAAHGAKLVAGTPTGFGAMLPLFRYPAVCVGGVRLNTVTGTYSVHLPALQAQTFLLSE